MKKTVKAWAVVVRGRILLWGGEVLFVSRTKDFAETFVNENPNEAIVPCTITYEAPKKARRKR